jgi:hypothetical protein
MEDRGLIIGKLSASLMRAAPCFNGFPANRMSAIVAIRFVQPAPHNPLPIQVTAILNSIAAFACAR